MFRSTVFLSCALAVLSSANAANQRTPGAGNERAIEIAQGSKRVKKAHDFLVARARTIRDERLRQETLDILLAERVCLRHREGLDDAGKSRIVQQLLEQRLVKADAAARLPLGDGASAQDRLKAGIFPAVQEEDARCVHSPLPFTAAPGSNFGGHHSYPGGLAVHASVNERTSEALAATYRAAYGASGETLGLDPDILIAAPIWHDWAKTVVFQWNADGSEFSELNFGGAGARPDGTDDPIEQAPGADSRTAAHHILGVAEAMARGFSPPMVIAQVAAHSTPTLDEYKLVNWLRAAAIIARVDPVARGYLKPDSRGVLRLPPLRQLGAGVDLNSPPPGEMNLLGEYAIHGLSDADFLFSIPVVSDAERILARLAPDFGFAEPGKDEDPTRYNTRYRNVVLAQLSAERILLRYAQGGLPVVKAEVEELRRGHLL